MSLVVLDSRANSMKRLTQCPQMTVSPTKKKKSCQQTEYLWFNPKVLLIHYLLDASKGETHISIKQCLLFEGGGGVEFSNQLNSRI